PNAADARATIDALKKLGSQGMSPGAVDDQRVRLRHHEVGGDQASARAYEPLEQRGGQMMIVVGGLTQREEGRGVNEDTGWGIGYAARASRHPSGTGCLLG